MYPRALSELIAAFTALPGVGRKTAERLSLHLVRLPAQQASQLAQAIMRLKAHVHVCGECGTLSEAPLCAICQDETRDRGLIAVVETPADLHAMEAAHGFSGLYHVLAGALSPLEGLGPGQLRLQALEERLQNGSVREVLIATNATVEGEATADLLLRRLQNFPIKLTRLAYGMPVGGSLQYMDALTLSRALSGRANLKKED